MIRRNEELEVEQGIASGGRALHIEGVSVGADRQVGGSITIGCSRSRSAVLRIVGSCTAIHVIVGRSVVVAGHGIVFATKNQAVCTISREVCEVAIGVVNVASAVAWDKAEVRIERAVSRDGTVSSRAEVPNDVCSQVACVDVGIDILEAVACDGGDFTCRGHAEGHTRSTIDKAVACDRGSAVGVVLQIHTGTAIGEGVVGHRDGRSSAIQPNTPSPGGRAVAVAVGEAAVA